MSAIRLLLFLSVFSLNFQGCTPEKNTKVRVASMSPSATQIVQELGKADDLIGRSPYCPQLKNAKIVGTPFQFNIEELIRLKITHVLTAPISSPVFEKKLQGQNIKLITLKNQSIEDLKKNISKVASLFQMSDQSHNRIDSKIKKIQDIFGPKKVLFVHSASLFANKLKGFFVAGEKSLYAEVLRTSGLKYFSTGKSSESFLLSKEKILRATVDEIYYFQSLELKAQLEEIVSPGIKLISVDSRKFGVPGPMTLDLPLYLKKLRR